MSNEESVVQASIVIITTAAGKIQDNSGGSLDSKSHQTLFHVSRYAQSVLRVDAVTLWVIYAFMSVLVSGFLVLASSSWWLLLPAARLSQLNPLRLPNEIPKLDGLGAVGKSGEEEHSSLKIREYTLKMLREDKGWISWTMLGLSSLVVVLGWAMFGLGVSWGVHGSVVSEISQSNLRSLLTNFQIAGTVGE